MHMQGYLFEPDIYVKLFFYFSTKKSCILFNQLSCVPEIYLLS